MAFLTPVQLELTDAEHAALVLTLGKLESGTVLPAPSDFQDDDSADHDPKFFFMQQAFTTDRRCGTAACILGWARFLSGQQRMFAAAPRRSESLVDLFFTDYVSDDGECAISCRDPAKGAQALRSFLTTGDANWPEVMQQDVV